MEDFVDHKCFIQAFGQRIVAEGGFIDKKKNRDLEKFKSEIEEIFVDEPESLHPSEVHAFFE